MFEERGKWERKANKMDKMKGYLAEEINVKSRKEPCEKREKRRKRETLES